MAPSRGSTAAAEVTEEVYTTHDIKAGVAEAAKPDTLERKEGESDTEFASRLQAAVAQLTLPAGTKLPDPDVWGDEARREREAHTDLQPAPDPETPAQLIDAETGDVIVEDATSEEAATVNARRNEEA
jgi:hypothetical protein